jgi:hypothetical protein
VLGVAVGAACVAVIPLWSARTTGSASLTPLEVYTRDYVPFDKLGFGVDTAARPLRDTPRDMRTTNESFREEHRRHTVSTLPRTLASRLRMIARDMWYDWRLGLAPFAVIALASLPGAAWFALATLGAHVGLYLLYAHPAFWTVYYLESTPVLAFVTAAGIVQVIRWAGRGERRATTIAATVLVLAACVPGAMTVRLLRDQVNRDHVYFERFDALVSSIPERSIVFVRYSPAHNDNLSLVRNAAWPAEARVWLAHDRGADNGRLMAAAPGRRPYVFDEASWTLRPLEHNAGIGDTPHP